ncbi:bet1-like protein At4g14600 [Chenopodium quinoa]|nr:bet1-like protein At4g14600 [Chenopodium quinoa]
MATRGGAVPFRSSDGLSTRQVGNSDEVQVRIVDPMHADLDDEITGLRSQVHKLRHVAQEINSEAKFQSDFMDQLQMTLIQVQASLKNNMRRLNSSIVQSGSNHVLHVVLFALFCLFLVYFWSKFSRH